MLHKNHVDIVKFSADTDVGFRLVISYLRSAVDGILLAKAKVEEADSQSASLFIGDLAVRRMPPSIIRSSFSMTSPSSAYGQRVLERPSMPAIDILTSTESRPSESTP